MRLIIVRHGETYENRERICQGSFNSQLTPLGIEQSKQIAERLKDEKIDLAYTSDLDRAKNTCEEIMKYHPGIKIIVMRELREQCKGVFECKPGEVVGKELDRLKMPYAEWKPEGGESLQEVWDKLIPILQKIMKSKGNILLVGHGGPIACMLCYLQEKDISYCNKTWKMENTAISIVNIEGDKIEFETVSCAKHLD